MPEIKFPSDWVKINENVSEGDNLRFLNAGVFDEENERWNFQVGIVKKDNPVIEEKGFTLNKTNFTAVKEAYGSNSDAWIGKEMTVSKVKVRNPQTGALVDGIALVKPV